MAQTKVDRLVELSMVPELAKEVAAQIESSVGDATTIQVAAFTAGNVTFPGGNLQEALESIATATGE